MPCFLLCYSLLGLGSGFIEKGDGSNVAPCSSASTSTTATSSAEASAWLTSACNFRVGVGNKLFANRWINLSYNSIVGKLIRIDTFVPTISCLNSTKALGFSFLNASNSFLKKRKYRI